MPRALSASRRSVPPDREAEYLTIVALLAARLRIRGERMWLFRNPDTPDSFLEFIENPGTERHGSRRASDAEVAELERRLEAIAVRAPDSQVLWEEVTLEER